MKLLAAALVTATATALAALVVPGAGGAVTCDRTWSSGSVTTFLASLTPGQTGCLPAGTYGGAVNFPQTDQITLASVPGQRATLTGNRFEIYRGGDDQTIRDITLVGTVAGAPTFQINGNRATLENVDLTNNHQAQSCIDVGYYTVTGFTLHASTVHGCGQTSNGNHDHGIYVEGVNGGTISDNVFSDNYGGWDIQAWPRANVTVERNVMRAASQATEGGLIIAGGSGTTSLVVRGNVMVGNGRSSMFDAYQLASGAASASGNCLVPNGSPVFESRWVNGGGNVTVSSEAACGTGTPTPTPTPTPSETPTPTATPTPTPNCGP